MIRFTDLVNGIQSAITGAVRGVEGQQLEALFDFFHTGSEEQERGNNARYENQEPRYENVGFSQGGDGGGSGVGGDTRFLSPKLVEMRFARETAEGPQSHSVFVPLISLVPMNELQIESLDLEMDVELVNHEDEMLVNSLSMMLPFSNSDKQALLESPTLADRRELLQGLIEFALHGGGGQCRPDPAGNTGAAQHQPPRP